MKTRRSDPIYEYDQWVKRYYWKKRIVTHIGYILAGFALALIVYAFIVLASAVLG